VIRIRPPVPKEIDNGKFLSAVQVNPDKKGVCLYDYKNLENVDYSNIQDYVNNANNYAMT